MMIKDILLVVLSIWSIISIAIILVMYKRFNEMHKYLIVFENQLSVILNKTSNSIPHRALQKIAEKYPINRVVIFPYNPMGVLGMYVDKNNKSVTLFTQTTNESITPDYRVKIQNMEI